PIDPPSRHPRSSNRTRADRAHRAERRDVGGRDRRQPCPPPRAAFRGTSRRSPPRPGPPSGSRLSLLRRDPRSYRLLFGRDPMLDLALEEELREVGHALDVEETVEVVALVLNDAGVEAARQALDYFAVAPEAPIADVIGAGNETAQARHRKAA